MNLAEFNSQIARLKSTYNTNLKDFYPRERTELLWRRVKNLDLKTFSRGIDRLISENRLAPMPKIIFQILQTDIYEASKREKETFSSKDKVPCNLCNNIGIVSMYKKKRTTDTSYSFQCKCECGRKYYPTLQKFSIDLLDDWVLY